jgi:hypothetical protein
VNVKLSQWFKRLPEYGSAVPKFQIKPLKAPHRDSRFWNYRPKSELFVVVKWGSCSLHSVALATFLQFFSNKLLFIKINFKKY